LKTTRAERLLGVGKPRDDRGRVCALGDAGGEVRSLSVLVNSGCDSATGNARVDALRGVVDGQTTS
jgi:hypothetical protein